MPEAAQQREDVQTRTYTAHQMAAIVGVSRWPIYQAMRSGELPSFMVAGRRLVERDEFERWYAGCVKAGRPPARSR